MSSTKMSERAELYDELLQLSLCPDSEHRMAALLQEDESSADQATIHWIMENAIKHHDRKIVELLLCCAGARISRVLNQDTKQTALHLAMRHDYADIVDLLFCYCDDGVNYVDEQGLSHLHIACITGNARVVAKFVQLGADLGFAALHLAVKHERLEVAELLLRSGAEPNAADHRGRTALHQACENKWSDGEEQPRMVGLLLRHGGDANARDLRGNTPLHSIFLSAKQSRKAKLRCLLEEGSRVNARNDQGDTVLHLAIASLKESRRPDPAPAELSFDDEAEVDMVRLILDHGASVNVVNKAGRSALCVAISMLSKKIVRMLLNHGADLDVGFLTPEFCYADDLLPGLEATHRLIEIVELLKSRGTDRLDDLSVMRFFVGGECAYAYHRDEFSLERLSNLLEFGTGAKIVNTLATYPLDIHSTAYKQQLMKKQMIQQLTRHVTILEKADLHVTDRVKGSLSGKLSKLKSCLLGVMRSAGDDGLSKHELTGLELEVLKMRATKLSKSLTLHDFVTSGPLKTYSRLKNSQYKSVVQSRKFDEDFPYTRGIVKGHFAKSLVRRYVTRSSMGYLRKLVGVELPDLCCERICGFLSNENLVEMCAAAER